MRNKEDALVESLKGYINEVLEEYLRPAVYRVDRHAERLDNINERIGHDVGVLTSLYERIDALAERVSDIGERVSTLSGCAIVDGNITNLLSEEFRTKLDELNNRTTYQTGYNQGVSLRIDELEKQVELLRDRMVNHSANRRIGELEEMVGSINRNLDNLQQRIRAVAKDELDQHLDSDEFRKRIFAIVEMQPQIECFTACVKDILSEALSNVNVVGVLDSTNI